MQRMSSTGRARSTFAVQMDMLPAHLPAVGGRALARSQPRRLISSVSPIGSLSLLQSAAQAQTLGGGLNSSDRSSTQAPRSVVGSSSSTVLLARDGGV